MGAQRDDSWRTVGVLRIEGGTILLTDPVTAVEQGEALWDEVLATAGVSTADLTLRGLNAIAVRTGWGDGTYAVEVRDSNVGGRTTIVELRVTFE